MKTVIQGAFVVSVDPAIGNIDGGDILVEDGQIAAIGVGLDAGDAERIDGRGMIALPGFVDAHRHLWGGAMRAVTADWSILDFAGNIRHHAARFFRPEDMRVTALHGALEALNAGVTTVADYCHNVRTPAYAREAIAGLREAGIRAVWGYSFTHLATEGGDERSREEEFAFVETLAKEAFGEDGLLTLGICPQEPFVWTDEEGPSAQFALARRLGLPLFMHANPVPGIDGGPPREVARLEAIGALGDDLALVHMGYTEADEWAALGRCGAHAVFTPDTELQMGMGWPPIGEARAAGVNIGLGCDTTANNSADMFTQMRLALQAERARNMAATPGRPFHSRATLECATALEWGTIGGAHACGLGARIGTLSPGKAADIVLLKGDSVALAGWNRRNPAATIVLQAGVADVHFVMVGGRIVKRDGRLLGPVEKAIRALEATTAHVRARVEESGGFEAPEATIYHRLGFGGAA